jgi:radical SAM protein with 4Fe4S-binding SPASM domain
MYYCADQPLNLGFSDKEIEEASQNKRLLSAEIVLFECECSPEELRDAVMQAKELGAKKIVLFADRADLRLSDLTCFIGEQCLKAETVCPQTDTEKEIAKFPMKQKCRRPCFSCVIGSQGDVFLCPGLNIPIGSIRHTPLRDILKDTEMLEDLTANPGMIKGPCRTCEEFGTCLGCRGAAYQLTGDYLGSDPSCPKNTDRKAEILCLPVEADKIIPQKPPMRIIDQLLRIGERTAEVSATIREDIPFIGKDDKIDACAYMEFMAQSIAGLNGFKYTGISDSAPEGYLLGAKDFEILKRAAVGDTLNIRVYKYACYGEFGIVKGTVSKDGEVLARGEIKIWHRHSQQL